MSALTDEKKGVEARNLEYRYRPTRYHRKAYIQLEHLTDEPTQITAILTTSACARHARPETNRTRLKELHSMTHPAFNQDRQAIATPANPVRTRVTARF